MGLAINRVEFAPEEFPPFNARLDASLALLARVLRHPEFGRVPTTIGAELELCLIDSAGAPLPENTAILAEAEQRFGGDNPYTVELNKHNLEINAEPQNLVDRGFDRLQSRLSLHWQRLRQLACAHAGDLIAIGILPTLSEVNLNQAGMTEVARYQALSNALRAARGEDFHLRVQGRELLDSRCSHVAPEGANTSFQFHLSVLPEHFADLFNAVQLTTPLALAVAGNSPCFMGKILWEETRIALFKQSIDSRDARRRAWHEPARVSFGTGWVRDDAWELFAEAVALYPPLFPLLSGQPLAPPQPGAWPELPELALHMGTTWHWNRPVYSAAGNGSVRIEMRALPAGPTVLDMMANAAFITGMAQALSTRIRPLLAGFPFRLAERNFYRAAQDGLEAELIWPDLQRHQLNCRRAADLVADWLPLAEQGLLMLGVAEDLVSRYLGVIEGRLATGMTGAAWQRCQLARMDDEPRAEAMARMLAAYRERQHSGLPVHLWRGL